MGKAAVSELGHLSLSSFADDKAISIPLMALSQCCCCHYIIDRHNIESRGSAEIQPLDIGTVDEGTTALKNK